MAIANLYLDKRRQLIDGGYPLKIRVTHERKSKYYATKYAFTIDKAGESKELNKIIAGKHLSEAEKDKKAAIDKVLENCQDIINSSTLFTFDAFELRFLSKGDRSCLIFRLRELDKEFRDDGKISTANIYKQSADSVKEFTGKDSVKLLEVTPQWLRNYEKWAKNRTIKGRAKNLSSNTIHFRLSKVQRVFLDAISLEEISPAANPFGKRNKKYVLKKDAANKRPLTLDEIMKLYNYNPINEKEAFAKDMFMFSYLASGMNMADIFNLKWSDIKNDQFEFSRAKNKEKTDNQIKIVVNLNDDLKNILKAHGTKKIGSDYVFDVYKSNLTPEQKNYIKLDSITQRVNRPLKKITTKLNIENATTYYARHSYANILMNSGAPLAYISKQLGHADIKTTQTYLDQFTSETKAGIERNLLSKIVG